MSTKCEGRFLVGVLVLCLAVGSAWQALGPTAGSASNGLTDDSDTTAKALPRRLAMTVQPFLERYCITCHGSKKPKASLDLSRQWTVADIAKDFAKWEIVLQRLQAEEMPPASAPRRPTVAELAA